MAVVLSAEEVWVVVGNALAGRLPPRNELWEMAGALQLAQGQLVRGLDRYRTTAAQTERSRQALRRLQAELTWVEQHRYGVLRSETAAALRRAHRSFGIILAILRDAAYRGPGAGYR